MSNKTTLLILAVVATLPILDRGARADNIGVSAKKLVVIDKTAVNGKAKTVFVSKDAGVHKGAAGAPQTLTGTLEIFYADDDTNRAIYSLPSVGWEENDVTLAKYRNAAAPVGGGVKVALVKPGNLAKAVGKSLGDASSLDVTSAPGAGGVMVVLTITNSVDTSVHRLCSHFPNSAGEIDHVAIAGGLGRRLVARDGVAMVCPEVAAATVPADTPVGTDTEADGATPQDPVETSVTSPNAGSIVITERPPAGAPPEGFEFVGQQSSITAPPGNPGDPLNLVFLLDLSALPPGQHHSSVRVFRDGVLVKPCFGGPGLTEPDPCITERELDGDDLRLTILSGHASTWTFGVPPCACLPGGTGQCTGGDVCKITCQCAPACDCCANNPGTYEFTSGVGAGSCGTATKDDGSLFTNLACNGFYYGGGSGTVGLPAMLADQVKLTLNVSSCDPVSERLELGPVPQAQTGSNLNCTDQGCLFGGPIPVPNPFFTSASTCIFATIARPASGIASCDGSAAIDLPLTGAIFLGADSVPLEPGIQPCPLCTFGTCKGGPNNGMTCTPASSDLGDAFPTSHDCPPNPLLNMGTVTFGATFTTGVAQAEAAPSGTKSRVFCGYCRDVDGTGGFGVCTGGPTPGAACAVLGDCGGTCASPKSCVTDADCAGDPRERCEQRNEGAFGPNGGAVKTISLAGALAGCLDDALPHASTLIAGGCNPPALSAIPDGQADLPGPTAFSLQGTALLGGPVPTTTTSSTVTTTTSTTTSTL